MSIILDKLVVKVSAKVTPSLNPRPIYDDYAYLYRSGNPFTPNHGTKSYLLTTFSDNIYSFDLTNTALSSGDFSSGLVEFALGYTSETTGPSNVWTITSNSTGSYSTVTNRGTIPTTLFSAPLKVEYSQIGTYSNQVSRIDGNVVANFVWKGINQPPSSMTVTFLSVLDGTVIGESGQVNNLTITGLGSSTVVSDVTDTVNGLTRNVKRVQNTTTVTIPLTGNLASHTFSIAALASGYSSYGGYTSLNWNLSATPAATAYQDSTAVLGSVLADLFFYKDGVYSTIPLVYSQSVTGNRFGDFCPPLPWENGGTTTNPGINNPSNWVITYSSSGFNTYAVSGRIDGAVFSSTTPLASGATTGVASTGGIPGDGYHFARAKANVLITLTWIGTGLAPSVGNINITSEAYAEANINIPSGMFYAQNGIGSPSQDNRGDGSGASSLGTSVFSLPLTAGVGTYLAQIDTIAQMVAPTSAIPGEPVVDCYWNISSTFNSATMGTSGWTVTGFDNSNHCSTALIDRFMPINFGDSGVTSTNTTLQPLSLPMTRFLDIDKIPRWMAPYYSTNSFFRKFYHSTIFTNRRNILQSTAQSIPNFFSNIEGKRYVYSCEIKDADIESGFKLVFADSFWIVPTLRKVKTLGDMYTEKVNPVYFVEDNIAYFANLLRVTFKIVVASGSANLGAAFEKYPLMPDTSFTLTDYFGDSVQFYSDSPAVSGNTFYYQNDGEYYLSYDSSRRANEISTGKSYLTFKGSKVALSVFQNDTYWSKQANNYQIKTRSLDTESRIKAKVQVEALSKNTPIRIGNYLGLAGNFIWDTNNSLNFSKGVFYVETPTYNNHQTDFITETPTQTGVKTYRLLSTPSYIVVKFGDGRVVATSYYSYSNGVIVFNSSFDETDFYVEYLADRYLISETSSGITQLNKGVTSRVSAVGTYTKGLKFTSKVSIMDDIIWDDSENTNEFNSGVFEI